jgi:hypothetical protein
VAYPRIRNFLALTFLAWSLASGPPRAAGAAEPPGAAGPLRAERPAAAAALRAEVDNGQAVVVWSGEQVIGRIGREAVDASGVAGRNRVSEFGEAVADAGRRQVLFSVRYAAGGSPNGPVGILQADPDGRNLAALYSGEGREARGLALSPDRRLLAFVLTWRVSACESLAWPALMDLDRPRDPEVWLPASLFLNEDQGELPYFHEVRWREDGALAIVDRPVTPAPECRRLPSREIAFDPRTRWFKPPIPPAVDLRLRVGQVLQGFLEAVASGDVGAAYERLSPAAQRQMPLETFRERFRRRPPAFTNGVRADDNRVTFRFLTQGQETYFFYTLIPMGGAWRISAIRERPTSSAWPE